MVASSTRRCSIAFIFPLVDCQSRKRDSSESLLLDLLVVSELSEVLLLTLASMSISSSSSLCKPTPKRDSNEGIATGGLGTKWSSAVEAAQLLVSCACQYAPCVVPTYLLPGIIHCSYNITYSRTRERLYVYPMSSDLIWIEFLGVIFCFERHFISNWSGALHISGIAFRHISARVNNLLNLDQYTIIDWCSISI